MTSHPGAARDFLPLKNEVLWILLVLHGGASHGYALMQEVGERSGGRVRIQTGALYRLLHRIQRDGLVGEVEAPEDETDERRRYYRLTPLGASVLARELERMRSLVDSGVREGVLPDAGGAR